MKRWKTKKWFIVWWWMEVGKPSSAVMVGKRRCVKMADSIFCNVCGNCLISKAYASNNKQIKNNLLLGTHPECLLKSGVSKTELSDMLKTLGVTA